MQITQKAHNEILVAANKAKEYKPYIRIDVKFVEKDERVISSKFTSELYVDSRSDIVEKHEGYSIVMSKDVFNILSNAVMDVVGGSITIRWT